MKVALLTQDDPFYLAESVSGFVELSKKNGHELVTAIVSDASPFGKRENFIDKATKTLRIFGLKFFVWYSIQFILRKFILRKSVVKELEKKDVPVWLLKNSINRPENIDRLKRLDLDVIVIIAGNQIIKSEVLNIPKHGVINAHSSLLPKYKGLMPSFWALKNNEEKTGVTVFFLNEGIDDGPIINQGVIDVTPEMTQQTLIVKCKEVANELLSDALTLIESGMVKTTPNTGDDNYYKFPTKDDVRDFLKSGRKFF